MDYSPIESTGEAMQKKTHNVKRALHNVWFSVGCRAQNIHDRIVTIGQSAHTERVNFGERGSLSPASVSNQHHRARGGRRDVDTNVEVPSHGSLSHSPQACNRSSTLSIQHHQVPRKDSNSVIAIIGTRNSFCFHKYNTINKRLNSSTINTN